jgi:two-component system CheB/CheR fusion protein
MAERLDDGRDAGVEQVLDHLKQTRAFDFTGYKRATLKRRIDKRMQQLEIVDHEAYVEYLEVHPEEFEPLFNTILINVSSFFRDPDLWAVLQETIAHAVIDRRRDGPIRIWSAGCAAGQEAYSAVMVFAEALGLDNFKDRVKVYATDIDAEALEQARQARYTARELDGVPPDLVEKYFDDTSRGRAFSGELRRSVIFGRHDLLQDAPISRIDLLLCRNTLMYFNTDVQAQLVQRLHFSLAEEGVLVLGKVETLLGQSQLFVPVDVRHRIFRKQPRGSLRTGLLALGGVAGALPSLAGSDGDRVVDPAFEHAANASILLDPDGVVVRVNARARSMFSLPNEVVGRPFQDLELSYRPVELRSAIDDARSDGRRVSLQEVERWLPTGELTFLDIDIVPLSTDAVHVGVLISFLDVTHHREVQEELERTHRELETAYEELQSANEELETTNEELETTNEELQSTIEELETTNEELQSTNEELETMNEELSSSNEELQAINDELRERTVELGQVTSYMEAILTSMQTAVVVVDRELHVRVWNGLSFEMWGLRAEEVEGRSFLTLDIGFPVEVLGPALRACLNGDPPTEPVYVESRTRRGQRIRCRARVAPQAGAKGGVEGVIILVEETDPAA